MTGSARLLRLSKDRPTSPACSYWWHAPTRGGSRFRLTETKTDRLGSSPCRSMKSGWQDLLLFWPPQICFRSSMRSASKLGVAQTTPKRAKSRNATAFSPHVEPRADEHEQVSNGPANFLAGLCVPPVHGRQYAVNAFKCANFSLRDHFDLPLTRTTR